MSKKSPPIHVGLIMDGNIRYALHHKVRKTEAYKQSVHQLFNLFKPCIDGGIKVLSGFALSLNNLKRSAVEQEAIFDGIRYAIGVFPKIQHQLKIRFKAVGKLECLPEDIRESLRQLENQYMQGERLVFLFLVAYSGQWDMLQAAAKAQEFLHQGQELQKKDLEKFLATAPYPNLDLIIRTGGDLRLSNFMLWQTSFAEFYFTPKLFPEFTVEDFRLALKSYAKRERRFGKVPLEGGSDDATSR